MFAKLSTLALLLPLVSATISINPISSGQLSSGQTVTLSWTAATTDPGTFSVELVNSAFNNQYAIANNIPTANGQLTITLPDVPALNGYNIAFISPSNSNQVYAASNSFGITNSASSGSSQSMSSTSSASSLSSLSSTTISSSTMTDTSSTSSMTLTTPTLSSTPVRSTVGTSSAPASSPSTFNSNGAGSFKSGGIAPAAALALSVVAGAAMLF